MRIFTYDIRRATTNALAIALSIAALISQSCATHSGHASTAAGSVPDLAAEHDALRCPPSAATPSDWPTVIDETGTYELRIPPTFGAAASGKYPFIHGGQAWESGDATISLSFGHWAEYSFEEQPGERCRVTIADANVFVILAPSTIVAWYDRGSGSHEPVVTVSSKNKLELRMLAPLALSLRRRVKP